jgi:hypothetical protein
MSGLNDLSGLGAYEFLRLLIEFSDILKEENKFYNTTVFSKYHKEHF